MTHIIIPKELFWQFKIEPNTPIPEALDWALSNFISTNLDTKLKVFQIGRMIEEVMEYYLINNKVGISDILLESLIILKGILNLEYSWLSMIC